MKPVRFLVEFAVHVSRDSIDLTLMDIQHHYGSVLDGSSERSFLVEASRASRLGGLKHFLTDRQKEGDLRWFEVPAGPD